MSPEVIENKPYNYKSDIWSLGVVIYEICCLKTPFEANNLPALAMKILK
jgi:NIMA (never in mitosis gene a)-related kinase